MPLVRSSGNIPADVEQEMADISLTLDDRAGGDAPNPTSNNPIGRPRTRQQTRRGAMDLEVVESDRVRRIVNDSLRDFRQEITDMISQGFRDLNLSNQRSTRQDRQQNRTERLHDDQSDRHSQSGNSQDQIIGRPDRNTQRNNSDLDRNSERILNLIRNWRIHFSGDTSEVTVDEFIYRVNTLTNANLNGDYNLLCLHAHLLFEGKALKWFWRYHRSCDTMDWDELCDALKRQYKDYNTDFDIKDDILRRKQKHNETFDEFYDAIMAHCDRLRFPFSEHELCETIQRNLRPELRHEILHLEITRVAQLRRAVRRHEKFVKDMSFSNVNKRPYQRTQISEVFDNDMATPDKNDDDINDSEVCFIVRSRKCWNCDGEGHSFMDCLEPRTVFCYGCGAKNVYKPKCPNCLQKQENLLKDVRAKKNGHPKQN